MNGAYPGGNEKFWTLEQPSSYIQIKRQKEGRRRSLQNMKRGYRRPRAETPSFYPSNQSCKAAWLVIDRVTSEILTQQLSDFQSAIGQNAVGPCAFEGQ